MTTANESILGGARGGHRSPIIPRVAAARAMPRSPRQPGGPFSVDLLHVVLTRAAAPRPSSGAIVRHWRHRQPGGGLPDASIRLAGAFAPAPARLHQRQSAGGSTAHLRAVAPHPRRPMSARRSRRPLPPYARSLPASARESHLISNRPNSRFDQFQLPMTSFVCSCHWPPNRFVTCARRCFRSHAT